MNKLFCIILLPALFAGCILDTSGNRIESSRLVIDNPSFASHFRVLEQSRRDTAEGFFRVQVAVRNDDRCDVAFQYRFVWLDADGIALPETMPTWHHATIHGNDKIFLDGVSERREAADFRLVMRNVNVNERW